MEFVFIKSLKSTDRDVKEYVALMLLILKGITILYVSTKPVTEHNCCVNTADIDVLTGYCAEAT
jgi:hypothetical protein